MINEWEVGDIAPANINRERRLDAHKKVESGGNPNAVSPAGAVGAYQFMPATARRFGLTDPTHEPSAREAASRYLADLERRYGHPDLASLAYNWGEGNVDAFLKTGRGVKGQPMPAEAQQYVPKILAAEQKVGGGKQSPSVQEWSDADVAPNKPPEQPQQSNLSQSSRFGDAKNDNVVMQFLGGAKHAWDTAAKTLESVVPGGKALSESLNQPNLQELVESGKGYVAETGPASTVGNVVGEIGLTLAPGTGAFKLATAPAFIANATSKTGKLLKLATGGAAAGATGEAMLGRDPLTGAAIGGAFAPLANVAGRVLNSLTAQGQRLFSGAEGLAVERAQHYFKEGNRLPRAISTLRATQPLVPGEMPTALRAATAELPELAVIEHQARTGPQARLFDQADEATTRARSQVLGDIEAPGVRPLDPATGRAMESGVEEARRLNTAPLYDAAMPEQVAIPRDLEAALMGSGTVGQATRNAQREFLEAVRLARAQGTQPPAAGRATPERPMQSLSVDQVQRIIRELDAIPFAQRDFNVTNARRLLSQLARQQSPNYRQATDLFRAMSAPQNQADVAGTLRQATVFANALRDAPGTIRKSGISAPFQSIEEIFASNPQGMQGIRNVEESLMREARTNAMSTNQNIAPRLKGPVEKLEEFVPPLLRSGVSAARGIAKAITRQSEPRIQKIIDEALVNPQAFAELLSRLPPTERSAILNQIRAAGANQNIEALITAPAVSQFRKAAE